MKLYLLKTMLLLCALVVGSVNSWSETEKTFNFNWDVITATGWSNSYAAHSYEYTEGTVKFTSASKQTGTITDVPVTKGQPVEFIMKDGYIISAATFTCKQWGSKAQTITLHYSTNGGVSYTSTGVTSTNFTITKSDLPSGTNAVKITFSSTSNQVGISSATLTYSDSGEEEKTETTTTIDDSAIGDTNIFTNTDSNLLSASVTADGNTVSGASITWSSSNTSVATIDNTGAVTLVAAGTTTITATYAGDDTYAGSSATYELTVTNDDPDAITLWSEDFSSYSADDVPSGGTYSYSCANGGGTTKIYAANLAGGTSPELLVGKTQGSFTAVVPLNNISGNLTLTYKTNAKSLSVTTTTEGVEGSGTFNTGGEHTVTFTGVTTDMTSITIVFTSGSDNVRLDDIVLKGKAELAATATITLNSACTDGDMVYGTYSNSSAFVVSDDIIVSEVGVVDGKLYVEAYETGDVVPANTGVMVSALVGGDYTVTLSSEAGTSVLGEDNLLRPTGDGITAVEMAEADANCLYYRLTMQGGTQIGFWWGAEDGAAFAVAANKAYLAVPEESEARMSFWFGSENTGISESVLLKKNHDSIVYDLQGRRVMQPTKGMYIVDGKKVMVK